MDENADQEEYPGKTVSEIRGDDRYRLSKPAAPAKRNYCNECSLTWYSSAFSDFVMCIRCKSRSVASMEVFDP